MDVADPANSQDWASSTRIHFVLSSNYYHGVCCKTGDNRTWPEWFLRVFRPCVQPKQQSYTKCKFSVYCSVSNRVDRLCLKLASFKKTFDLSNSIRRLACLGNPTGHSGDTPYPYVMRHLDNVINPQVQVVLLELLNDVKEFAFSSNPDKRLRSFFPSLLIR